MNVFHPAVFANGQIAAGRLQVFLALVVVFTRLQALGGGFMGGRHGAVALNVGLGFFVAMAFGMREGTCQQPRGQGQSEE